MENNLKGRRSPPFNRGLLAAKRAAKKERAIQRNTEYSKLTTPEKLARLDKKLGAGVGASKQRARLAKQQ